MKENLNKFLSKTLMIYYFLLVIIVILKLIGFEWFSLDTDNKVLITINEIFTKYYLTDVYYGITMILYAYVLISISCDDCSKHMRKYVFKITPLLYIIKIITTKINISLLAVLIDTVNFCLFAICFSKKHNISIKQTIKNYIKIFTLTMIFQIISMFVRVCSFESYDYGFIINAILDIDYLILSFIYYELHFNGGVDKCSETEVGSSSQKQVSLTNLFQKYQISSLNNKEKFELILSFILTLFWNCFTVFVVLIVALLNNTMVECVFILISFWSSKLCFGKPFHFKSVIQCFIVSNLTYYALNRITLPIGISVIVPIVLGVGLSYFTAKKTKAENRLYKGMSEESLYEILKKVTDDPIVIKICKEFYCDRYSDAKISLINNYSVPSVRLKRQTINKQLKELNK